MKKFVCLMLMTALLAACNATKEDLGLSRKGPDASKVSEQKQLLLPPNYNLRPVVSIEKAAPVDTVSADTRTAQEAENSAND